MQNQLSIYDLDIDTTNISTPKTFNSTPGDNFSPDNIIPFPKYPPHPSHSSHPKYPQQKVSPIRDPEKVKLLYNSLLSSGKYGLRNATIFALQLAIGRRTNDIAHMRIGDVYDFKNNKVKSIITVDEHKTGKTARDLPLNSNIREKLGTYIDTLKEKNEDSLLFPSNKHNKDGSQRHLNTASLDYIYQVYTSTVFDENDEETHISTYAARKTYGYNIYSECMKNNGGLLPGTDIHALQYVQSVFNHKDSTTTLRYIGAYDAPAMELAESIAGKYDF